MKENITLLFFLFSITLSYTQIKGIVTDNEGKKLPSVAVFLNNTVSGTTTNNNGEFLLDLKKTGKHTIVFQFLGYKTLKKTISISSFPFVLNVKLEEELISLDEIVVSTKENPANAIIRKTIASKNKNTNKWANYTANFYSRGLFKVKEAPKKILGQELGDLGGGLDSTRSGIIYLSETMSDITYQKKPFLFKEKITASKVSGEDNGISFNRAQEVNLDFYQNIVPFGNKLISPIADAAFKYYKYKLEGSFYDENARLINKIKLLPKRKNDPVFNGFIYIVENDWTIYGADVTVRGKQVNIPVVDVLRLKQTYNYDKKTTAWLLISQVIDFKVNIFGFKMNGRFSAAYSNYKFHKAYKKGTFTNKVLSFDKNATKKDSIFWNKLRPVPLTTEETKDYTLKDSIKTVHTSKKYLDSLDFKKNKFKLLSPLLGYTYRNSHKKWSINYSSPLPKISFNPVQGWNSTASFNYFKRENNKGKYWNIGTNINYGLSEKKVRSVVHFTKKWNNFSRPQLSILGGTATEQFNDTKAISNFRNNFSALLFKENYIKLYEKSFVKTSFSKEITNGVLLKTSLEFSERNPLFKTTDFSFIRNSVLYTTNNPIDGTSNLASFVRHQLFIASIGTKIVFNQKYLMYPNSKYNIDNNKYPTLFLNYRKTFGASLTQYNSDLLTASLRQFVDAGRLGQFKYYLKSGLFLQKKDIAFMDYVHFNGNRLYQTVSTGYTNKFGLLDYYAFSTNDRFTEIHTEHNFKGFLLNKVPLISSLNLHLVTGAKALFTGARKPYTEYSIGFTNIRFNKLLTFRLDFVKSFYNGFSNDGIKFGYEF